MNRVLLLALGGALNVIGLLAVYLGWVCGRALHGGTP